MLEITTQLQSLNRPSLLVRTAKIAINHFNRELILFRIFGYEVSVEPTEVIQDLIEREEEINTQRKTGDVTYNIARHISVLTALMNEAEVLLHPVDSPT